MNNQQPPTVSIIILNWNGCDDTLACLNSLAAVTYLNFTVVVVDNGSTDDSLSRLRPYKAHFPLTLLETNANLGFAEGNNVGVRNALVGGAEFVLLLNNDTEVDPGLVGELVRVATAHPAGGVFSAKIFYHAEPKKLWYAGAKWLSEKQHFQHVGIGEIDDGDSHERVVETDYASGCALFIRADVIKKLV